MFYYSLANTSIDSFYSIMLTYVIYYNKILVENLHYSANLMNER